ncbi:hypothetical protein SAMN05421664_1971 [Chryseobacterium soldanellicola]|uniref:Uncharacterized protein n=1 Tax=Chryseobacterium soldanellicola TaxID=311333 RepID=A0A1H1CIC1_9FLAO|nr:hypothetical protein SAMN05421664_1971 [Chryseobacterium soldanellicola]
MIKKIIKTTEHSIGLLTFLGHNTAHKYNYSGKEDSGMYNCRAGIYVRFIKGMLFNNSE